MNFGQAVSSGFRRYIDFSGRSSRSEYWWWILLYVIIRALAEVLIRSTSAESVGPAQVFLVILSFLSLALLVPSLAVALRRLHDLDRSGWWILISFVPIVGGVVLLVWFCTKGTVGSNKFGADPLG